MSSEILPETSSREDAYGVGATVLLDGNSGIEDVRRIAAAILRTEISDGISVNLSTQSSLDHLGPLQPTLTKNAFVALFDMESNTDPAITARIRSVLRCDALRFFASVPVVTGLDGNATHFGSLFIGDAHTPRRLDATQEGALIALGHQLGALVALGQHKRRLEEETVRLSALATTDGLTGLANRRSFGDRLTAAIAYARQTETPLSLILMDVDRFKPYNDMFGHPAGDEVLRQVGRILSRVARDSDIPARYGGEEFAVLLPETDGETGAIIADLFRSEIASSSFPHREVTASFGVAELSAFLSGGGELVSAADAALYKSKANGRNQVTLSETTGR
jgi:diguanylate cyclase (GGDEF)-like protein